jgi:RHS repeat-associated protein
MRICAANPTSAERRAYLAFGKTSYEWTFDATLKKETKGFIGERYDADAGLQFLNARYYDPELGMFIQPDWLEVTEPGVGTNRYS